MATQVLKTRDNLENIHRQRCELTEKSFTRSISKQAELEGSKIVDFYKNRNVLITGASGFLGKVILWKLIESCPDVGKIYILMRSKNSTSPKERLIQMLKSQPFTYKHKFEDLIEKIIAIESDMAQERLGLSASDEQLLEKEVHIVLHSAASVKFDAPIKESMRDNVLGTRSILSLCKRINNLQALVHVSTAYSNCQLKDVREELEPVEKKAEEVFQFVNSCPTEVCDLVAGKILEGRPNTYTYTKAIAEQFVAKEEGNFPISIVRPSIVIPATKEPCPGWVDNFNGITGLGCLAAIGLVRDIDWNYYAISDMVPVDFVANCILCAAHHASVESPKKMTIYNMTSGNVNPISWGVFFDMLRVEAIAKPSNKVLRPITKPPRHNRANKISFAMTKVSDIIIAYLIDMLLTVLGHKKILTKITRKMHAGYSVLQPFTSKDWNFECTNLLRLSDSLTETDKELFKFNMKDLDWKQQATSLYAGVRLFLLKEKPTEESYESGRRRYQIATAVHYTILIIYILALTYIGYCTARLVIA